MACAYCRGLCCLHAVPTCTLLHVLNDTGLIACFGQHRHVDHHCTYLQYWHDLDFIKALKIALLTQFVASVSPDNFDHMGLLHAACDAMDSGRQLVQKGKHGMHPTADLALFWRRSSGLASCINEQSLTFCGMHTPLLNASIFCRTHPRHDSWQLPWPTVLRI